MTECGPTAATNF